MSGERTNAALAAQWAKAGPLLAERKRASLPSLTIERNRDRIDRLMQAGADHAKPRRAPGYVEFYRLMARRYP